jgi:hypothetical protein
MAGTTSYRRHKKTAVRTLRELPYPLTFATCQVCGRTVLMGERLHRMARDEETVVACPLCAQGLVSAGYRHAA